MLENVIKRNVKFAGTFYSKITKKNQTTIPSELRSTLMLRQDKEDLRDIVLYYSINGSKIVLKDRLSVKDYPKFFLVSIEPHGRIVLPSEVLHREYAKYVGKGNYIEVSPVTRPR